MKGEEFGPKKELLCVESAKTSWNNEYNIIDTAKKHPLASTVAANRKIRSGGNLLKNSVLCI